MALDLNKLSDNLDRALANETKESLLIWLKKKRMSGLNEEKIDAKSGKTLEQAIEESRYMIDMKHEDCNECEPTSESVWAYAIKYLRSAKSVIHENGFGMVVPSICHDGDGGIDIIYDGKNCTRALSFCKDSTAHFISTNDEEESGILECDDLTMEKIPNFMYKSFGCKVFVGTAGPEKKMCDGCNVREPFEHRCHGEGCECDQLICQNIQGKITHEEMMKIVNGEESGGYCCDSFEKFITSFDWMQRQDEDGSVLMLMPNVEYGRTRYRVNFCPSCGKSIRNIEIHSDAYSKLMEDEDV